ncbi:MAG: NAD-dependent malic enzyme [Gammaproteobacteria bacterium]|nr:NAD-dependent malic enzyme [Gammaproteobacteria bacterium]MDH5241895.1 NAD-dependent malic enzyme [Gammaproteobacteria bacterium]MDH5262491.1 NAD-dependent malic enzyme [Gammaproteobacteria bacterium]MDH5582942.1 NAD-dependent malic enzyme [Gammaproteobacteria bacterium]
MHQGVKILHDPIRNKGTAFTEAERDALNLRGLLPPRVHSMAEQELRVLHNIREKATDLDRYLYLIALQDRNENLFYRVVMNHLEEMMPILYTPTVGQACMAFRHLYRKPRGFYVSLNDKGNVAKLLNNWPHKDARIIVVTDGERILGLGDLGADGMGIPIGKLALYTACAGIHPTHCLPVMLDVGTDNERLLNDPLYNGLERRRARGKLYDELVDEFITAASKVFPGVLIQLEDFGNTNAFRFLEKYRDRACVFDDDIQGTGAVAVAGLIASMRITGSRLSEQKLLFLGAGEAGIGIADVFVAALVEEGMSPDDARAKCWFVDSKGLVCKSRDKLAEHKLPYAHDYPGCTDLITAVHALKPTAILGLSGQPNTFTQEVIEAMASYNDRPIIFALSNPTSKAECTAEEAYGYSDGRAIFASGSPFDPVTIGNKTFVPGQGNNAYIFPGVGLGVIASGARRVPDEMFLAAAQSLASQVTDADLERGRVYPSLTRIREVSSLIARDVAQIAFDNKLTDMEEPEDLLAFIHEHMYQPVYPHYA